MQNNNQIIRSLLDTDLYKFTMQQTVYHQFPQARNVKFNFKCRTKGINLQKFISEINNEIDHLCSLKFSDDELTYLGSLRYMKPDYIDFLRLFHFQRQHIKVVAIEGSDEEIDILINGPWLYTILYEVYILSIINEIYFRNTVTDHENNILEARKRLADKINYVKQNTDSEFKFSDFGTRRRYSRDWHNEVVQTLKENLPDNFTGTSNVYFAMKYNLTPIGTMAHEYLQACQALGPRLRDSQKFALEKWVQEYRGDLGIALTDVIGIDAFISDFDLYFCKLFDGVRHDSGDPIAWGERFLEHYKNMKIDARTKSFVFSDGLDMENAINLHNHFFGRVKTFFGIGTNLTNDTHYKALNIVLKMTECNGSPVAKLSDSAGKTMCKDEGYLTYLKEVFNK